MSKNKTITVYTLVFSNWPEDFEHKCNKLSEAGYNPAFAMQIGYQERHHCYYYYQQWKKDLVIGNEIKNPAE